MLPEQLPTANITLKKQVKGKIYVVIAVITVKNKDESI